MFGEDRRGYTEWCSCSLCEEESTVASEERLRELEDKYEGFKVYDNRGEKIGKVDDLFIDENDREEYIGVKMGLFGMKSTLIPMEVVRVNEAEKAIEVAESKDHVKDAPTFGDDDDIDAEYENRIRSHFGLESLGGSSGRGSYGAYAGGAAGATGAGVSGSGEREERDEDRDDYGQRGSSELRDDSGERGSSGVDTEYGERSGSSAGGATEGVRRDPVEDRMRESSGRSSEGNQSWTGTERSGDREGESTAGFGGGQSGGGSSSFGDSETREMPTNRRTEETETFEEGGRTKVRRRIIREEIVEEDPNQR